MTEYHIQIAEHVIHVVCESALLSKIFSNHFQILSQKQQQRMPDLHIRVIDGFGASFTTDLVKITRKDNDIFFQRTDYFIQVDTSYQKATIWAYNGLALKHAMMNLYSSFIVHHEWGLLIHSSCVLENRKGHLFAGHSGDGKSTAARLSFPRKLFADEASIVKMEQEQIKVFNSPFRSGMKAGTSNESAELASIQLLRQSKRNERIKLEKSDALLELMDKIFFWSPGQTETRKIVQMVTNIVKKVPIYELYFQKNPTFWELISS